MIVDNKANKKISGIYLIDGKIDGTQLGLTKKPNFLRRFLIRMLLGWKWIDCNKLKK